MSARWALVAVALLAPLLSGCGEKSQVVTYKQGKYQGKPDTPPWKNERFKDDKVAWENAIKQRNQAQNEYNRVP